MSPETCKSVEVARAWKVARPAASASSAIGDWTTSLRLTAPTSVAGFVSYLLRQLRWELKQLGVPRAILWQDRAKIDPGDYWSETIRKALNSAELFVAILSKNYITSAWWVFFWPRGRGRVP